MQSSKGNENGEKTTIGLIGKKANLQVQHTFFYISLPLFARLQRKTSRNFLVTHFMTYVFLFTFFSLLLIFTFGHQYFSFSQRRYKFFMLSFQKRMSPLFFISRSSSLSLFFSLSFAGLSPACTFSFSLSFYFSVSQIADITINLSLILLDNTDTVVSAS